MSQTPYVGAPQGAVWGFDPTTNLWLPIGASAKIVAANGEEYASLMVAVSNANSNGQATSLNSSPVVVASDQSPIPTTPYANGTAWPTGTSNATAPIVGMGLNDGGFIQVFRDGGNVATAGATGAGIGAIVNFLFNGTNWDAQINNTELVLLASAARTTTQTLADQTNFNGRGVMVVLDVTVPGTGSITLEIDGKDPASGKYIPLLTGAAVTTLSTNVYTVYPGITATANVSANQVLPRTWHVKVTANNANPVTYSCGGIIIL